MPRGHAWTDVKSPKASWEAGSWEIGRWELGDGRWETHQTALLPVSVRSDEARGVTNCPVQIYNWRMHGFWLYLNPATRLS